MLKPPRVLRAAGDLPHPCVWDSFCVTRPCPVSPLAGRARGTDPGRGACSSLEQQEPCTGPLSGALWGSPNAGSLH